ncbi:adenylyltransferase/sulfurtransferase [Sphingobium sp. B7D2B]|uniref:HesA/MoeB/ThiF family protein n=1 Tax=Sphingobium sp. B7D2B TaxID=2940583 RepID=UPI00222523A7|nr:HesA/MoeB/ThiF family protein [Sphingobium sp. B7D2B]MCW2367763.1 adenylyltransferase/sulfurtransferase [Sphingobium sp. B7D2B]
MDFTDDQLERYARHIVLREIGGAGQARLAGAHVAIIGAGGIGCPAIAYLAAAGIGTLRIIDHDMVSLSNLQRQILFASDDIGRPKAEAARDAVRRLNPDCHAIPINTALDADNAETLLRDADIILDGCDNFETRLAVSDAATRLRIPLVSAAVGQFEGQIGVWRGWEEGQPCYRCLVGETRTDPARTCAEEGIVGALTGIIGSMAALEAIRALVPFGETATGKLIVFDLLARRLRTMAIPPDPACKAALACA